MALTQGYEKLGIIRQEGKTVYREWAPGAIAAQLIGDFNGWHGTWMERDEFGNFSVTLPDGEQPALGLMGGILKGMLGSIYFVLQQKHGWPCHAWAETKRTCTYLSYAWGSAQLTDIP